MRTAHGLPGIELAWNDPIDAAPVVAVGEVGARFEFLRHELWMLDDGSVHINDIQGPVGTVLQVDGAKPLVLCGQKLNSLAPGREANVAPSGESTSRWTRLPVGSQVKLLPWNSFGSVWPR